MKQYFIGLTLAPSASTDSGIAVIDSQNQIILLDKLFTMNDVQYFFENYSSIKESQICISLPSDNSMLNGKWRILSKLYQQLNLKVDFKNINNWTQRYSSRGSDYFAKLIDEGISINRFELYLTRQALNLNSCFKERSPADCKALQNALKIKYGFNNLPTNMMPMAQLEAITGAILAKKINDDFHKNKNLPTQIFEFNGIPVIRG